MRAPDTWVARDAVRRPRRARTALAIGLAAAALAAGGPASAASPPAMLGQIARYLMDSGGTFRAELHSVLADDEHIVAGGIVRGERNGRTLADRWVQVAHVRDGRIVELWNLPGDQHAVDEFWS